MTFHLRFAAFFNYLFPPTITIVRWNRSSQASKYYCCAIIYLFNMELSCFTAIYELIHDKKKRIFTTPPPLLLQRPPLVSPDTWEKGGNKRRRCLSFEPDRSEVLSKRSQVPIFLRSEEEGEGGAGEGVKEDRWRWRRAKKKCWKKRSREGERARVWNC